VHLASRDDRSDPNVAPFPRRGIDLSLPSWPVEEPANHLVCVSRRTRTLFSSQTLAGWMAALKTAMTVSV
jgi:hypothetical protein